MPDTPQRAESVAADDCKFCGSDWGEDTGFDVPWHHDWCAENATNTVHRLRDELLQEPEAKAAYDAQKDRIDARVAGLHTDGSACARHNGPGVGSAGTMDPTGPTP